MEVLFQVVPYGYEGSFLVRLRDIAVSAEGGIEVVVVYDSCFGREVREPGCFGDCTAQFGNIGRKRRLLCFTIYL